LTEKTQPRGNGLGNNGLGRLFAVEHRTVSYVSGPLLVAEGASGVGYDEVVDVVTPAGEERRGQVLEVEGDRMVVQVLGGTRGLDRPGTIVRTRGEVARMAVGPDLIGRILDGSGSPHRRRSPAAACGVQPGRRRAPQPVRQGAPV
jgi:V/A-type H+-transporting ATPase subunit B